MVTANVAEQPASPEFTFYDPANDINEGGSGGDTETSLVVRRPTLLDVQAVGAAVVLQVQVKVGFDSVFKLFTTLDGSVDDEFLVEFLQPYNFLRIVRTAGAADPVAKAQFGNVGHGAL